MELGNKIFELRKKSNLSQEQLAEIIGVSRQTISKWELNESVPDIIQSKKISELFNVSLDRLVETYDKEKYYKEIWHNVLLKMEDKKDAIEYLKMSEFKIYQEDFMCISFPHLEIAKMIKEKYGEQLKKYVQEEDSSIKDIKFIVTEYYII